MIYFFLSHFISFWLSYLNTNLYPKQKASLSKREMIPLVLFNQFILLIVTYQIEPLITHITQDTTILFWFLNSIWKFPLMILTMNFFFGTFHYLSHRFKWIYQNVHYVHHRLVNTDGMGAIYAHPLEHIFINMLPVGIPILLFNVDFYLANIFIIVTSWEAVKSHTIYLYRKSSRHRLHHYYKLCNYDNNPYILDRILGTYRKL